MTRRRQILVWVLCGLAVKAGTAGLMLLISVMVFCRNMINFFGFIRRGCFAWDYEDEIFMNLANVLGMDQLLNGVHGPSTGSDLIDYSGS